MCGQADLEDGEVSAHVPMRPEAVHISEWTCMKEYSLTLLITTCNFCYAISRPQLGITATQLSLTIWSMPHTIENQETTRSASSH